MSTYQVDKNEHRFKPGIRTLRYRPGKIGWWIKFDESCIYDLKGVDQLDYNKLCGISFSLFTNHRNSVMAGWRWNISRNLFELTPYLHINGKRMIGLPNEKHPNGNTEPVFTIGLNQWFAIWMVPDYKLKRVVIYFMDPNKGYMTAFEYQFKRLPKLTREIETWFGGNQTATHRMKLERKVIRHWKGLEPMLPPDILDFISEFKQFQELNLL